MTDSTEEQEADELAAAEGLLAGARSDMQTLITAIEEERWARVKLTITGGVIAVLLLLGGARIYQIGDQRDQDRCDTTNESRASLRDAFAILVNASVAAQVAQAEAEGVPVDPALTENAENFTLSINSQFPPLDC